MSYQVVGKTVAGDSDDDVHVRKLPSAPGPSRNTWTMALVGLNVTLTCGVLAYASSHGQTTQEQLSAMKASLLMELAHSMPSAAAPNEAAQEAAQATPDDHADDGRVLDLEKRLQDTQHRLQDTQHRWQDTKAELAQALAAPPPAREAVAAPANPDFANVLVYKGIADLGQSRELHSQFGQDWVVSSILGCKKGGFFIDLAANDYKFLSNTLMLERDFDWQGICLDANSEYIYGLAKRKCRAAIAAIGSPKNEKVTFVLRGALGGILGKAENSKGLKGMTREMHLASFIETLEALGAPPKIDFMSLDVEGAEEIVMATFPWDKYTVSIMTVERPNMALKKQLESHGYRLLRINKNRDQFWVHESLPGIDNVVSTWSDPSKLPESTCMDELKYERPVKLLR